MFRIFVYICAFFDGFGYIFCVIFSKNYIIYSLLVVWQVFGYIIFMRNLADYRYY